MKSVMSWQYVPIWCHVIFTVLLLRGTNRHEFHHMNLASELPFWLVRDGLIRAYPPLEGQTRCDALIIGGGISGALVAMNWWGVA